jgi:hypothetical protein
MTPKIYFCLSSYHVNDPDGSTFILAERAKACQKEGIDVVFVTKEDEQKFGYMDYDFDFISYKELEEASYKYTNLFITSWDNIFGKLLSIVKPERCILYAQSYHSNHDVVRAKNVFTVSEFAATQIYNRFKIRPFVVENGIRLDLIKKYRKEKALDFKYNQICTTFSKRDKEICDSFSESIDISVVILPKMNHEDFIQEIAKFKYHLNYYKVEGFGLPSLEAMGVGTVPIILSNHGSSAYANDTNCIGLGGTMKDIIRKIGIIQQNNELYEDLVNNGVETSDRFDLEESNNIFVNKIKELL